MTQPVFPSYDFLILQAFLTLVYHSPRISVGYLIYPPKNENHITSIFLIDQLAYPFSAPQSILWYRFHILKPYNIPSPVLALVWNNIFHFITRYIMFVSFPPANINIKNIHDLHMISKDLETSWKLMKYENPFPYRSFLPSREFLSPYRPRNGGIYSGAPWWNQSWFHDDGYPYW